VSRIVVTHAHIDHYGLAGRLLELTGAEDYQRNYALSETLAHVARLRWSGRVERRIRWDGMYEWYAVPASAGSAAPVGGG